MNLFSKFSKITKTVEDDGTIIYRNKDGLLHNPNGYARRKKYFSGFAYEWRINGQFHREDGPALINVSNGCIQYFKHGILHRDNNLPAEIFTEEDLRKYVTKEDTNNPVLVNENELIESEKTASIYHVNGILHRDNGPAIICPIKLTNIFALFKLKILDKSTFPTSEILFKGGFLSNIKGNILQVKVIKNMTVWCKQGILHCDHEPALQISNEEAYIEIYAQNGILNNDDLIKPSIEVNTVEYLASVYYRNGKKSRINGPALIIKQPRHKIEEYWYDGIQFDNEQEYNKYKYSLSYRDDKKESSEEKAEHDTASLIGLADTLSNL
jgi:hypothetical protein